MLNLLKGPSSPIHLLCLCSKVVFCWLSRFVVHLCSTVREYVLSVQRMKGLLVCAG